MREDREPMTRPQPGPTPERLRPDVEHPGDVRSETGGLYFTANGISQAHEEALAAELVRRWNAYPALLAACEALVRLSVNESRGCACRYCGASQNGCYDDCPIIQARSALAAAKGGGA